MIIEGDLVLQADECWGCNDCVPARGYSSSPKAMVIWGGELKGKIRFAAT